MAEKQLNPIIDLLEFDFSSFKIEDFRKFIHVDNFTGPSLYFHKKAIEMARNDLWFLSNRHIEYIYATLASWGMHRMGSRGAKMPYFEKVGNEEENRFKESILIYKKSFLSLRKYKSIVSVSEKDFNNILPELTKICFEINATKSDAKLVSGSKTLAHILPDLVPPIDRQYTLKFMYGNKNHPIGDDEKGKEVFKEVMQYMYNLYNQNHKLTELANESINSEFNTSLPKIFDNIVINRVRELK